MVDHDQQGIKTRGKGEIGDEITGDLLKGARGGGGNGQEGRPRWMCVYFVLLARSTPFDITANIGGKAWPPKLGGNQLVGFQNSWMAGCGVVMVASND